MLEANIFLGVLHETDLEWLVANSNERDLPPETVLIRRAEPVQHLYLIVNGTFDVTVFSPDPLSIATLYSGELAGEMSFVDMHPPSATVTAKTRSRVLAILKSSLVEKIRIDPGFGARFYKGVSALLAGRLRAAYSVDVRPLSEADAKSEMAVLEKRYDEIQNRLGLRPLATRERTAAHGE
jgi:CRP-like cAMP-binding protein